LLKQKKINDRDLFQVIDVAAVKDTGGVPWCMVDASCAGLLFQDMY
jgi:hypothetical protein